MDYYLFILEMRHGNESSWTTVTVFKQYPMNEGVDTYTKMFGLVNFFNMAFDEVRPVKVQKLQPYEVELESRDIYGWDN